MRMKVLRGRGLGYAPSNACGFAVSTESGDADRVYWLPQNFWLLSISRKMRETAQGTFIFPKKTRLKIRHRSPTRVFSQN